MVRNSCNCVLGPPLILDQRLSRGERNEFLGIVPFDEFRITSAFNERGKKLDIPFDMQISDKYKKNWLTPPAPVVFITAWHREGRDEYVLSKKKPTLEELILVRKYLLGLAGKYHNEDALNRRVEHYCSEMGRLTLESSWEDFATSSARYLIDTAPSEPVKITREAAFNEGKSATVKLSGERESDALDVMFILQDLARDEDVSVSK